LEVTFMRVLPSTASVEQERSVRQDLRRLAADEMPGTAGVEIIRNDDVIGATVERAAGCDVMILGLHRHAGKRLFGERAIQIARRAACATAMISRRE
jgi:hypothetical protein